MNSEEVILLLRQSIRHYLDPESIRPSETQTEASVRQLAVIRECFEELRRYLFVTGTGVSAAAVGVVAAGQKKPPPPMAQSNAFHEQCLTFAQMFIDQLQFREALNTCLAAYHDSRAQLDEYAAEEAARLERGGKMAALLQEESTSKAAAAVTSHEQQEQQQHNNDNGTNKKKSGGGGGKGGVLSAAENAATSQIHRHRAVLLTKLCAFFLTLEADPHVEGSTTSKDLETIVDTIVAEIQIMTSNESLYFLVYNATLIVFQCCQELIRLGSFRLAAPYLAYCGRVMDSMLPLATVKFLPWRMRLYSAVCLCYEALLETKGALRIAQHALRMAENLYELEMSDVVPPPQQTLEILTSCLLEVRLQAQRLQLRDSATTLATANASAAASAAAGSLDASPTLKASKAPAKGAAATAASPAPGTTSTGSLPASSGELVESLRSTIRNSCASSSVAISPNAVTIKSLDVLCTIAVDYNSRWMAIPAGAYDNTLNTIPTDKDVVVNTADTDPLKLLAADAIVQQTAPMVEAYFRKNLEVAKTLGWGKLYEEPPRPTTADDGSIAGAAATTAGGKKAPPAKAAGKKAPAAAPPSPTGSSKLSPGMGGGVGETNMSTSLDEFVVQGLIPVSSLCAWVRSAFTAHVDVTSYESQSRSKDSLLPTTATEVNVPLVHPPTTFNKLLVAVLEIIRTPSYHGLFPDPNAGLNRSVLLPSAVCSAATVELALVQKLSSVKCALFDLQQRRRGTTDDVGSSAVELLRTACVSLADSIVIALQERALLALKSDLFEDAARILVAAWADVPHRHEAKGAAEVYSAAAYAFMATGYPDVLTTGNCALTASRLLQEQDRHGEALLLVRPVEEFLAARQSEYVFNHNSWNPGSRKKRGSAEVDGGIFGETLERDHAATLDNSLWLKTVRDIRTHLIQHLTLLRLAVAASKKHEADVLEHSRKVGVMKTREEQSHLFGSLSRKEKRAISLMEAAALEPPTTAEAMERKLSAWAGTDAVHAALVWIEISKRQSDVQAKKDKLKKASEFLQQAQFSYDATLRALLSEEQQRRQEQTEAAVGRGGGGITMLGGGVGGLEGAPLSGGAPTRPGTAPSEFALGSAISGIPGHQPLQSVPQSNLVTPRQNNSNAAAAPKVTPGGHSIPPLLSPRGGKAKSIPSPSNHSAAPIEESPALSAGSLPEVTSATGLSIYLVWALFGEACSMIDALELCKSSNIEEILFARFVIRGNSEATVWNKNPFAVDSLNRTICNTSSTYLLQALGKALGVIAAAHALETPYTPDGAMVDDDEDGLDKRRLQLRTIQRNFARCGNTAIMGLELAASADDQASMALLSHQVFNCTLPLLISKNPSMIALRPITTLFHVMMLFEKRRWSDGPLQYLAARTIRAAFAIAKPLSPAAQRPVLNAALSCFSHVWPLVLQHPNVRQTRHIDTVVRHIQYVDRVMHAKFRKPVDATATPADVPVKGAKGAAAKGGAASAAKGAAAAAAAAMNDSVNPADASLYFRTELFFDDLMPMEYLELLDEIVLRVPGGVALCEQLEGKYVPPAAVIASATSPTPTNMLATSTNRPATGGGGGAAVSGAVSGDEPPRRTLAVRRDAKTLFPPLLLQAASMLATGVHPTSIIAKIQEVKSVDPFFSKVCSSVALEFIARRQDEFAVQLCTEGIKEILKRHDKLTQLQKESLKILRDSLTALGHYAAPANATGAESAAQTASMEERLLQKMSRRISEIRRRFAFKRLRSWFLQYDLPFQALLNLMLSICSQHDAEKEKARLALLSSQGVTPQSAQPPAIASPPAKAPPAAAASAAAKKGAEPPAVSSALHSGMTPEDRFQQSKEDAVKFAVKAAVLFNRCYRVQYTYVALQTYVNAMRSLFANEPPSMLSDVLQQARIAEQGGGVSSRSAGSTVPGQQAYHLTLHTANTKPIMDSISKVETPCKVMANEIIKLLKQFQDGFANAAKEVECLQPVSVKTGEDCLPERGGIIRRTTSLQMWLTEEGQFEEHRRDVQDLERKAIRERIYERERNEMQEVENWERLVIFKNWVKEFLDMSKGEGASDDNALVESLYLQFRALTGTAPSSRHSETTEGSQRVGTGVSHGGDARGGRSTSPIPPALIKSNRKAAAKKKIFLLQNSKLTPALPAAALADESDGAQAADVGYQTIDFQSKLGKNISLDEIIRCFSYVVRCLQYGQRKQSAVAMTMEVNEITKNHYATLLLPYALNLQSAMGQNTEKIMLKYVTGHREIVRTKKLIQEAHRMLSVYKESDAYRRAQLKLANTLQPSRRGIVVPQDAEVGSIATSATGAGGGAAGGGGGSAYKEVVSSFQSAVGYLRQKHSTLLLVGVLYELGHLHLHHRVRAEAERSWNDVVDAAFSAVNALKNWRSLLDTSINGEGAATTIIIEGAEEHDVLNKIGLHKGIMSAAALSSLAMYSYAENQKKATEACLLAAEVLRSIIGAGNLGAPQRPWDHGRFTPNELFVNAELSETYSEFMPTIVNGFLYVAQHLVDSGYPQHAVYAANIAEYLALNALRAKDTVVYARLIKAKAAAASTNFRGAIETLHIVASGKTLPDPSGGALGVFVDVADADAKSKADNTGGAASAATGKKDAKAVPAKGKPVPVDDAVIGGAGADATTNAQIVVVGPHLYDNSKPPTDADNLRAVEGVLLALFPGVAQSVAASLAQPPPAVLTFLAPSSLALVDAVALEYGPILTRQVLATVSHVMLSLASCDAVASWQAAADAQSAADAAATAVAAGGKGKTQDKKDPKGGAAVQQQQAPSGPSGVAVALKAVEVIAQALAQCVAAPAPNTSASAVVAPSDKKEAPKSKDAAAAAALAAVTAAAAPSSITSSCSAVEQSFWEHQSVWMQAQCASLQGQHKQAATLLKTCLDSHNSKDTYTLSVAHVPSFSMSTTGRFLCDVYALMGKCYVWLREFPRAEEAAASGALIADHCGDSFAQREFAILKMSCALRRGDGMTALDDIDTITRQCKALAFRGIDSFAPNSVLCGQVLHHAIVDDPRLHQLSVLLPMYDAAVHCRAREALQAAAKQLSRRAEDLGLNIAVDSSIFPTVVNAHSSAVYELHHTINHLAELQMRCNMLSDAVGSLRWGLTIAAHYDTARMPHEISCTKLLLAVALRQQQYPDDSKSGMALVCSLPNDRPLSSHNSIPTTEDELTAFFENGHHPRVREIVSLLRAVIVESITKGTHDYEVLRTAFTNLAFVTGRHPQLAHITVNLTALAGVVSSMQAAVMNNVSMFASPAVTPENPTGALGIPGAELSPAVIAFLEDIARRDAANQKLFTDNAQSLWQHYTGTLNAAAGASVAAGGKGAPAGAGNGATTQPPASTNPPPVSVTLPAVASTFVLAHNERPTALAAQRVTIDSLLLTLRSFLQSKAAPFSLGGIVDPTVPSGTATPSSSANPWLLFSQPPRIAVAPNAAASVPLSSPGWFPKANYVFTQNFVSNVSSPTYQEVEGELKATLPFVTMLLTVSAVADAAFVTAAATASAAAPAGGKGAAAAKGAAPAATPAAAASIAAAPEESLPSTPIVLSIPCIPQKALTSLHHKANELLRKHTLLNEVSIQLEEVLQEAMGAVGGAVGGGGAKADPKKGAAAAATVPKDDALNNGAGTSTGMTPRLAPRHTGPTDDDMSEVLLGFIELLVTAGCGETAPKNRDAFYPNGAITMDHVQFIAHATNVDGGWSSLSHVAIHEWALTLGREMIRCITRGDGKS